MKQNAYLTVKHKIFQASLTLIMRRKTYWYLMIHLILVSCNCNQVGDDDPVIIPVNEKHYPNMSFHIGASQIRTA